MKKNKEQEIILHKFTKENTTWKTVSVSFDNNKVQKILAKDEMSDSDENYIEKIEEIFRSGDGYDLTEPAESCHTTDFQNEVTQAALIGHRYFAFINRDEGPFDFYWFAKETEEELFRVIEKFSKYVLSQDGVRSSFDEDEPIEVNEFSFIKLENTHKNEKIRQSKQTHVIEIVVETNKKKIKTTKNWIKDILGWSDEGGLKVKSVNVVDKTADPA